jgi:hypothetical protein
MKKLKTFAEAMDLHGQGQYFDHGKKRYVSSPNDEIQQLTSVYPEFKSKEIQTYLELITSQSYNSTVEKLARYLNINVDQLHEQYPNFSSLYALVIQNLYDIIAIEDSQRDTLERLAVNIVLSLPEFKLVKDLAESGELKIIAKLEQPNMDGFTTELEGETNETPPKGELTTDEEKTEQIFGDVSQYTDLNILARRSLARTFTQGAAVNKFYLFHMAEEQLGKDLINKYGIFSAIATLGYFGFPLMNLNTAPEGTLMGKAESEAGDESDTITATGLIFPALIHELVKGIYNYLTYDIASQEQLDQEDLNKETLEMMSGPQLAKTVQSLIDINDQYLTPYILKLLIRLPDDQIKAVLLGDNTGKRVIQRLVQQAKEISGDQ